MQKCTVTKPFEHMGRTIKPGSPIELHPRQAESLRLQGKVKFATAKPGKGKKK